jgi:chromosome segregation ATPase
MDSKELELLMAIQSIIDPLKNDVKDIKDDMQEMKDDMQDMKDDIQDIKDDMQEMKDDMQEMKTDILYIKGRLTNVENEVQKTNIIIETEIRKNIRLLVEGHQGLKDRLWHLPEVVEELKEEVEIIKFNQREMAKVVYKE